MKILYRLNLFFLFLLITKTTIAQSSYYDYGFSDRENILYDSFNNENNYWRIGNNDEYKGTIENGNYSIQNKKSSGTITSLIDVNIDTSKDFEIEGKIKHVYSDKKTLLISLIWGANTSEKNYFGFTAQGSYRISKYENGGYKAYKDWTDLSSISKYEYNKLTIRKVGSKMYFFINAKFVHSMYFKTFFGKRFGFQSPNKTKIRMDYFRVSYLKKNKKQYDAYTYSDKTLLMYESFSDNDRNWQTGYKEYSEARVANGAYYLKNPKSTSTASSYINKYIDTDRDFEIETKIKYISGKQNSGLMLVWGRSESNTDNNNIEFTANGKYWIGKYKDKKYISDVSWTPLDNIKKYDYNTLTVRKIGNKYYYYINKKYVYSSSFTSFYGHKLGFVTPSETEIKIDYLKVSYLDTKKEKKRDNGSNEGDEQAPSGGK